MTDLLTASDWVKGIGFSILASIVGGCGKLAIRKSWLMIETSSACAHLDNNEGTPYQSVENHKAHFMATMLRGVGMIAMIFINPLFCILAMQYASPSILAPFSGLTLVWIILFSEISIGEKPLPKQIAAAVLIITGEVLVAVWGDHTNDDGVTIQQV
jgi:drug/metabolite transporter (DMT)-like permease